MDITPVITFLNGLGPWGIAIGLGLALLWPRIKDKIPSLTAPTAPATPTPADPTIPVLSPQPNSPLKVDPLTVTDRPLLRILLQLLAAKSVGSLSVTEAGVADLLHKELTEVKDQFKAQALPPK